MFTSFVFERDSFDYVELLKTATATTTLEELIDLRTCTAIPPFDRRRIVNVRLNSDRHDRFAQTQVPGDTLVLHPWCVATEGNGGCWANGLSRQLLGETTPNHFAEIKVGIGVIPSFSRVSVISRKVLNKCR